MSSYLMFLFVLVDEKGLIGHPWSPVSLPVDLFLQSLVSYHYFLQLLVEKVHSFFVLLFYLLHLCLVFFFGLHDLLDDVLQVLFFSFELSCQLVRVETHVVVLFCH